MKVRLECCWLHQFLKPSAHGLPVALPLSPPRVHSAQNLDLCRHLGPDDSGGNVTCSLASIASSPHGSWEASHTQVSVWESLGNFQQRGRAGWGGPSLYKVYWLSSICHRDPILKGKYRVNCANMQFVRSPRVAIWQLMKDQLGFPI